MSETKVFPAIERAIDYAKHHGFHHSVEADSEIAAARRLVEAVADDPHIKSVQVHQCLAACRGSR